MNQVGKETLVLSILSFLVSLSLGLSIYIFNAVEKRLGILEAKVDDRIERLAILEQQSKENVLAHARLEVKLDTLLGYAIKK